MKKMKILFIVASFLLCIIIAFNIYKNFFVKISIEESMKNFLPIKINVENFYKRNNSLPTDKNFGHYLVSDSISFDGEVFVLEPTYKVFINIEATIKDNRIYWKCYSIKFKKIVQDNCKNW